MSGTNEFQDLLEELNACAHAALDALASGNLPDVKTALKGMIDEIGSQLEGSDE